MYKFYVTLPNSTREAVISIPDRFGDLQAYTIGWVRNLTNTVVYVVNDDDQIKSLTQDVHNSDSEWRLELPDNYVDAKIEVSLDAAWWIISVAVK